MKITPNIWDKVDQEELVGLAQVSTMMMEPTPRDIPMSIQVLEVGQE